MIRNSPHTAATLIFWPVDDVDSQSSPTSCVQPVIDAGKQRRSASAVDGNSTVQIRRPALGDVLFRRLKSGSLPTQTGLRPPLSLLPEKTSQAVAGVNRGASAAFRATWAGGDGSTDESTKTTANGSGGVTGRSVDSRAPWYRRSDDESPRRSSVELYGTARRGSAPAVSCLTKCPSASSLGGNVERRRPWINKYLQQFAETDDAEEKQVPRRRGSVAALISSFEQCALDYGTIQQTTTSVPRGGLGRAAIHGSLTNLDSIGRRRGSGSSENAADRNSGSRTSPPTARSDVISTKSPALTSQPVHPLKSRGEYVETRKTRNDVGKTNQDTTSARRCSVDIISGSRTNLNCIGRTWECSKRSEIAADEHSARTTISPPRLKSYGDYVRTWNKRNDNRGAEDQNRNTIRHSSVDVVTPTALFHSDSSVSVNQKPVQPYQQRGLSVLGRSNNTNNTDSIIESAPSTENIRGEVPGSFPGTLQQRETSDSCESGDGSLPWASGPASESLPTTALSDSTSYWAKKSIPTSFAAIDDNGGDFESDFWQYGGISCHRRTGSLVSDSNNTEDSGVASSEYTSSMVDWSRSEQDEAQDGGSSRYRSKSGTWTTHRANDDDDDNEKRSITGCKTPPSHEQLGTKLAQSNSTLHGSEVYETQEGGWWRQQLRQLPGTVAGSPSAVASGPGRSPTVKSPNHHSHNLNLSQPTEQSNVEVVGGPEQSSSKDDAEPPTHHNQFNPPPRSSLTITLAPTVSPLHVNHQPGMTSPDGHDVMGHPAQLHGDVTRHVVQIELDKGVAGVGFCIEGGKQSLTGDQPITVKRIFRCETSARKHLRVGDVILSANGKQMSEMTHYEAWNYLKEIPDRVIHLVIARS